MTDRGTGNDVQSWVRGRLPSGWYGADVAVTVDRDEILVTGPLADTDGVPEGDGAAEQGRISRFREETRAERVRIAREAEGRCGRTIAWGASCGATSETFTTLSVPVMTRLRQPERLVLDTLVDAGVARSRSHALAWCVRLVGKHTEDWLAELRAAMSAVQDVRDRGPESA